MKEIIFTMIISFIIPILIYIFCAKILKKPLINIPVFIVLLLYHMFDQIFLYQLQLGLDIDFVDDIVSFFRNDSVMVAVFIWFPAIIGFAISNIIGFFTSDKFKGIYYRIKYRPKRGEAAASAVFNVRSKYSLKNDDYAKRLDSFSKTLTPCAKTNAEVFEYLNSKYELTPVEASEKKLKSFKINYILNVRPDVLTTPEYRISTDKAPSRKEYLAWSENNDKRFKETISYPMEKLDLDLSAYSFKYSFESGNYTEFLVVFENNTDEIYVSGSSSCSLSEEEGNIMRRIGDDIALFKGITQYDIDNKTNKFKGYASILMSR